MLSVKVLAARSTDLMNDSLAVGIFIEEVDLFIFQNQLVMIPYRQRLKTLVHQLLVTLTGEKFGCTSDAARRRLHAW